MSVISITPLKNLTWQPASFKGSDGRPVDYLTACFGFSIIGGRMISLHYQVFSIHIKVVVKSIPSASQAARYNTIMKIPKIDLSEMVHRDISVLAAAAALDDSPKTILINL